MKLKYKNFEIKIFRKTNIKALSIIFESVFLAIFEILKLNFAIGIVVEILFSFVGKRQEARSEFAEGKKKDCNG